MAVPSRGCAVLRLITRGSYAHARPLPVSLISVSSLLRSLPLFVASSPRTPLRVLCIVALDTIHGLRYGLAMPRHRRRELAALLDFQACANAMWDQKVFCAVEYEGLRQRLQTAGFGNRITEYLRRLHDLESQRPSVRGDRQHLEAMVRTVSRWSG